MDLTEIWRHCIAARQVPVPHERSVMRITFDAAAAPQCDRWSRCLAEAMLAVDRHGDHRAPWEGAPLFRVSDFRLRHVRQTAGSIAQSLDSGTPRTSPREDRAGEARRPMMSNPRQ